MQSSEQLHHLRQRYLFMQAAREGADVDVARPIRFSQTKAARNIRLPVETKLGRCGFEAGLCQAFPSLQVHRLLPEWMLDDIGT